MTFTLELGITASPSHVFDFVADFASTPRWYSAVQRVEHVHGDGEMGTRYSVYRRLPSGPVVNVVEVIGYTQGKEVAFTSVEGPTPFTYRYRVEPTSSGTRLELEGAISAAGLPGLARLLGPAAERLFKHGMQENLGALKELLERQPHSG
ncbi:SRPBCC family protein [Rathayibacter sp. KR2-224]|uniref:SRPBCC family protein n=1 Tax=Rathayibacter sp. KR2-224 TaxID=3400913 RepID=UPI003C009581